eukprot:g2395.t1
MSEAMALAATDAVATTAPPYFEAMVNAAECGAEQPMATQNFLFATAGYPTCEGFVRSLVALSCAPENRERVHAIEVGIPASDPIADGPVIEECYRVCLLNGVTSISAVFDLLQQAQRICKAEHGLPLKPIILMGYMNSLFEADPTSGVFGLRQNWGDRAARLGLNIRHAIIVDCTAGHIQIGGLSEALGGAGVSLIPVIAENVEDDIIEDLVAETRASDPVLRRKIVYCTNYLGVTGGGGGGGDGAGADGPSPSFERYLRKISQLKEAGHFILMGFGIRTLADVAACRKRFRYLPNAAVVGTAYMKALMSYRERSGRDDPDLPAIEHFITHEVIEKIFGGDEKHLVAGSLAGEPEAALASPADGVARFGLKICGFKTRNQTVAALTECVDYFGFNFHKPSPRYCLDATSRSQDAEQRAQHVESPADYERVEEIFRLIHDSSYHNYKPLSVSVSVISGAERVEAEMDYILGVAQKCPSLDILQLHMKAETLLQPAVLDCIGKRLGAAGKRAILAFAVSPEETADMPAAIVGCLEGLLASGSPIARHNLFGLLVDVKTATAVGGTGQQWSYIEPLQRLFQKLSPGVARGVHFFVAGGVGPDYVLGQGSGGKLKALHAEAEKAGFAELAFDCCSSMECAKAAPVPSACPFAGFGRKTQKYGPFPYAIEDFDPRNKATGELALDHVHKSAFKIRYMSRVLKPQSPLFFGMFGGAWVSSLIMSACTELSKEFATSYQDPLFWQEYDRLLRKVAGRPTGLYRAASLTTYVRDGIAGKVAPTARLTNYMSRLLKSTNNLGAPADLPVEQRGASIYLKREDLLHTGAHKINNAIYQIVMAKRMGKKRIIAETGAGQHGVACAAVCAVLNEESACNGTEPIKCRVYMGAKDAARQALNVLRIESMGTELFRVQTGDKTLRAAVNETMRDWSENIKDTHYVIGSAVGPSPFPYIVREAQSCIGREARGQFAVHPENNSEKVLPKAVLACAAVLNFFEQFLYFLPTIEDRLPTAQDIAAAVAGDKDIIEENFAPSRQDNPRLFKLVDTLLTFREVMLEHFTAPFDMKVEGDHALGACIVGTGGDGGRNPHNVSTPAGIVAAAAADDVNVLKWGISPDAVVESMEDDISGQLDWDTRPYRRFRRDSKGRIRYPEFRGGFLGFYGFENVTHAESTIALRPRKDDDGLLTLEDLPLNSFGRYNTFLIIYADGTKAVYTVVTAGGYKSGVSRLKAYERTLCEALSRAKLAGDANAEVSAATPAMPLDQAGFGEMTDDGYWSNFKKDEFVTLVGELKERIRLGELIQVVPSRTAVKDTPASPAEIFQELTRVSSSSPYKYVLRLGNGFTIVGASPELLMKAEEVPESDEAGGDDDAKEHMRKITTCPIAGTRRRGKSREEDIELGLDLLQDEKELSEHVMLVDLARNDLGKLCQHVRLEEFDQLKYYSNVMHICSTVSGVMRVDSSFSTATVMDALKAVFPCGTLSGAPKIRACQTIVEVEGVKQRRNLYGGGLGFVSFGNTMELCIAIRTLVHRQLAPGTGRIYLQAGAGIVWDSVPEAEYDETSHKMGNLRRAVASAEGRLPQLAAPSHARQQPDIETGEEALVKLSEEVHTLLAAKKAAGGVPESILTDDRMLDMEQTLVAGSPVIGAGDIRVLLIDNFCSFTHNIFQVAAELVTQMRLEQQSPGNGHEQVHVIRNNKLGRILQQLKSGEASFTHVIIGPGPGNPVKDLPLRDLGEIIELCNKPLSGRKVPVLGVCLGMQFLVEHFGGTVECCAAGVMHGKLSRVDVAPDHAGLLPHNGEAQRVMRYHSLAAAAGPEEGGLGFPTVAGAPDLRVIAFSTEKNGEKVVQAVQHSTHTHLLGVQFHPESVGTKHGAATLRAFLQL